MDVGEGQRCAKEGLRGRFSLRGRHGCSHCKTQRFLICADKDNNSNDYDRGLQVLCCRGNDLFASAVFEGSFTQAVLATVTCELKMGVACISK